MAKWGEGDPRWLVQNRDDGKNVNGWHWEEKNRLAWSKERIGALLTGLVLPCDASLGTFKVSTVKEISGDAYTTTRKGGVKFAHYDLKITLAWEAVLFEDDKTHKGEISIDEFASGHDHDDYVYTVTADGTGKQQDQCRRALQVAKAEIYDRLRQYSSELESV